MSVKITDSDFYSLHGIWGASGCLALGRIGRGAGIVVGNVQPPNTGLFVGYRAGNSNPILLPFAPNAKVGLGVEAFQADAAASGSLEAEGSAHNEEILYFGKNDIERSISMSGEEWRAGYMTMTVSSFFGNIPDPAKSERALLRKKMRPAMYVRLSFDNSTGVEPLTGIFGMQGIRRPLSDAKGSGLLGFAHGTDWGFAVIPEEGIDEVMDWTVLPAAFSNKPHYLRHLASEGCLRFNVPAYEKKEYIIALGVFRNGNITSGIRSRFYQSGLFRDLEDVLTDALAYSDELLGEARRLDEELDSAPISNDRKFLIAHAAHSYTASTELLADESGQPLFVVNEGEYQMMNTLDLTVDQAFHELHYSPWTVKNELDFFHSQFSYRDKYGLAFAHDQGVADCFTPKGTSSYELPKLTGCFSYMTYEETLNWILTACLYSQNADDGTWYAGNQDVLSDAVRSILSRDANGDGIMDIDSDLCKGGSEITTYDSLDTSLGQARNNLYIAVKAWATFLSFISISEKHGLQSNGKDALSSLICECRKAAGRIASSLVSRVCEPEGFIPAVFEGGNSSRIIPAVEGLIYPFFCGAEDAVSQTGPYRELIAALRGHLDAVLKPGVCLDGVSGGWKLSSTSRNTWLSKIFINQYVAETILCLNDERTKRDAVHVRWQCVGSADWAATDQVESTDGKDLGSRLYPRLVSSILWIHPPKKQG